MLSEKNIGGFEEVDSLVPLLNSASLAGHSYRSDDQVDIADPVVTALLKTRPLRRLSEIGFLGAIDYLVNGNGPQPYRRRHNRREHSIAVAQLADIYTRATKICRHDRQVAIVAALLHDVGHGPLSHSLEPVFQDVFGIDHHKTTREIILGTSPLGTEIRDILDDAGIDPIRVIELTEGTEQSDIGVLFSGQINIDTLEGITRCRAFMHTREAFQPAQNTVYKWALNDYLPFAEFDAFWELKHTVYNSFIGSETGALLDCIVQVYMTNNLSQFSPTDYFLTEKSAKRKFHEMFKYLELASKSPKEIAAKVPSEWLRTKVNRKIRTFEIEKSEKPSKTESDKGRYSQRKSIVEVELGDLLER